MSGGWVRLSDQGEFQRIREFAEAAGTGLPPEVVLPPGDDAVALRCPEGEALVLGTDATAEGIHFRRAWTNWETVGRRAVSAALSDLAAVAARPLGALVTVLLPPELDRDVLLALGRGVGEALHAADGTLLGGDLSRSESGVTLDVVAVGSAAEPVSRTGARAGDRLWVTGSLGGAATAVADWQRGLEPDPRARRAFEHPRPRWREARWLAERAELHAVIDLSDGLAGDAGQLAAASGVRLELRADALPLAPVLEEYRNRELASRLALSGGEDYELLLATPADLTGLRERFRRRFDLELTRVGRVVRGEGVWIREEGSEVRPLEQGGFDHFRDDGDG